MLLEKKFLITYTLDMSSRYYLLLLPEHVNIFRILKVNIC